MFKHNIAYTASLIGDAARSAMLIAMLQGRALTAGELASYAHISPQTASSHLNKLMAGGLIAVEVQGRHRYYRLASIEVAHILEAMALVSPKSSQPLLIKPITDLQTARTCYDHIAGKLGVTVTQSLLKKNFLTLQDREYQLSAIGRKYFVNKIDIDIQNLETKRRRFAYPCLDWSERIPHLAGSLGAAMLDKFIEKRWVLRAKEGRVLYLTSEGKFKLNELFKIKL